MQIDLRIIKITLMDNFLKIYSNMNFYQGNWTRGKNVQK